MRLEVRLQPLRVQKLEPELLCACLRGGGGISVMLNGRKVERQRARGGNMWDYIAGIRIEMKEIGERYYFKLSGTETLVR